MRLQAAIGPILPICLPSISFFVLRPKFSSQNYYAIIRWISFWRSIFNFHVTVLSQDINETFILTDFVVYYRNLAFDTPLPGMEIYLTSIGFPFYLLISCNMEIWDPLRPEIFQCLLWMVPWQNRLNLDKPVFFL